MYHCKILFCDKMLKLDYKGQKSIPTLRKSMMQRAMLGFQMLYNFEGVHLNNHDLMG